MTGALGRVLACASCVSSAYGDRTFNWAYTALMIVPFAVGAVVAIVLAGNAGYRLRWRRTNSMNEETTTT
jgi:ABC-type Fe3+ transport system permease subunit